jgi:hypothetical protein
VLDVFRFAWFVVRTFAGFVLLVLTLHAALWVFVKIDSMATPSADPDAASRLVKGCNAQRIGQVRKPRGVSPAGTNDCGAARRAECGRH